MKGLHYIIFFITSISVLGQPNLELNEREYFHRAGLDVTVFSDYYPDGHQSGVTIIQHGNRVAANGDLRLEPSPGQWSPVPKEGLRQVDRENQRITQELWFPDTARNGRGFNPIEYPDLAFRYKVEVEPSDQGGIAVAVHLEEPIPEEWSGRVGFNLELFPGDLFGVSYLMDSQPGIFPDHPVGSVSEYYGEYLQGPMATGRSLVIAPEHPLQRMVIRSEGSALELWDGRVNHNNGWFIVRSRVPAGATRNAIRWQIDPHTVKGWEYDPVLQVSQLGYHPDQEKRGIVELDPKSPVLPSFSLLRLGEEGPEEVYKGTPVSWGGFLRYSYAVLDFTEVREEGLYQLEYGDKRSHAFRIEREVFNRGTWQATLEYFLPVQMCHMRVNEKYRVWHDLCHMDDARMAPPTPFHFDGYRQGQENYTSFEGGDPVPGLNRGGWHDAGDYDLRVESQAGTVWTLARMIEEFGLDHDATSIDFENRLVEIHQPDGHSDALQQIEHGLATILGGYRSLGRLYRGIICSELRQYVLLGDGAAMTDNQPGNEDDRWVFTEQNPRRELDVIPALAAAHRVLLETRPELAEESLATAEALWERASEAEGLVSGKVQALTELLLSTGKEEYRMELLRMKQPILENISRCGWSLAPVIGRMEDPQFVEEIAREVEAFQDRLYREQQSDSPYGVPYKPNIWGAGWSIQRFGVEQYFYQKGWPELAHPELFENALHFVLGVHPGSNNASFVSGVGSRSVKVAYGVNRADWSYIPGGVASGTALIRPDLPEMKVWPFLWQQTEYVMGGGGTHFMFLTLAVHHRYQ